MSPISHIGDMEEILREEKRVIDCQTLHLEKGGTNGQICQCWLILREQEMKIWELASMICRNVSTRRLLIFIGKGYYLLPLENNAWLCARIIMGCVQRGVGRHLFSPPSCTVCPQTEFHAKNEHREWQAPSLLLTWEKWFRLTKHVGAKQSSESNKQNCNPKLTEQN